MAPLAPERYKLQVTLDRETYEKAAQLPLRTSSAPSRPQRVRSGSAGSGPVRRDARQRSVAAAHKLVRRCASTLPLFERGGVLTAPELTLAMASVSDLALGVTQH